MPRSELHRVFVWGLLAALGIVGLTPALTAQSTSRPNVLITRMPALSHLWPADFNQDGITDVLAARANEVVVMFGNGDGTFADEQVIGTGANPVPGDFNADGHIDVAVSTAIIPGQGNGTFAAPVPTAIQTGDRTNQVADMNGDGHVDLIAGFGTGIFIYPGDGAFGFSDPAFFGVLADVFTVTISDFNSDGINDFALTQHGQRNVLVYVNQGSLSFTQSVIPFSAETLGITAWDWNIDGITDLIVSTGDFRLSFVPLYRDGFVHILLGNGDGTFSAPATFPTNPGPRTVVVGDFNGDGVRDVATGNLSRGASFSCETSFNLWTSVSLLPGQPDGTLGEAASFALGNSADEGTPFAVYRDAHTLLNTSDLNADGRTDLIASPGAILLSTPPSVNRQPEIDAGVPLFVPRGERIRLNGFALDPDNDWLTFQWTDESGRLLFAGEPQPCVPTTDYEGPETFTLTVTDGRGATVADTVTHTITVRQPAEWTSQSIGAASGVTFFAGSTFTVSGAGADIWGTADAFHFNHQPVSGDFEITARVTSVENVDPWTKAGLMIREDLTASARHAFVFATPEDANGVAFQRRPVAGGSTVHTWGPFVNAPVWLRLLREGDVITAFTGASGTGPWTPVDTQTLAGLPHEVRVGLAVTSHVPDTIAAATFDGVTVAALTPGPGPSLPAGWSSADVGVTGAPGSGASDGSSFTVEGSGADIWGASDAFHYVYRALPADGTIVARVTSLDAAHEWSKAGLMIRHSLDPSAPHHFLLASGSHGLAYQRRLEAGQGTLHTALAPLPLPAWFAISRSSLGPIQLAYSADGVTWTPVAAVPFTGGDVLVGLAVTSHAAGQIARATFDNVALHWGAGVVDADIGGTALPGSATFDGETLTITGSGADVWGTADAFHYSYRTLEGDGAIIARIGALDAPDAWTKAGVMIRDSTGPSASHAFVFASRDHGFAFQRRTAHDGLTTHTAGGSGNPPRWLMLERAGGVITASVSGDAVTWTVVGSDVFPDMQSGPVLIGMAITSHNNSTAATATFDSVMVAD